MGILKDLFRDNRVLTAKNPEIQEMIQYMGENYGTYILEYTERHGSWYVLQYGSTKYLDFLYKNGYLYKGLIKVPGRTFRYETKIEAYEGLVWLYNLLEEQERNQKYDKEWF